MAADVENLTMFLPSWGA